MAARAEHDHVRGVVGNFGEADPHVDGEAVLAPAQVTQTPVGPVAYRAQTDHDERINYSVVIMG